MLKLPHSCSHLTHYKVMLKILQARLQQYVKLELPDVKAGFRKGRGTRDEIANIHWIIKKHECSRKTSTSALHQSLWLCRSQQTVENSSRDGNTRPPDLPLEKATVRTGHGTTNCFHIGKGVHQDCILSPCLFNLFSEYIMRNAGLDEVQAGIKMAGRNIDNFRYTYDTTIMAESEEPLDESWLKTQHSEN